MRDWVSVPFCDQPKTEANGHAPASPAGAAKVFVALPTYNGWLKAHALVGLVQSSQKAVLTYHLGFGSLLTVNFNSCWCAALNSRAEVGWTDFAMHHADISAPELWLDTLLEERRRVGADILSVVVAIKDGRRLTSTGVVQENETIRRLTMKEVHRLPETFCTADLTAAGIRGPLVVNTGLWVCDFTQPWIEEVCFRVGDGLHKSPDGRFRVSMLPEDWNFSYWAHKKGLKVFATRKVRAVHWGEAAYPPDDCEDGWPTDLGDDPEQYEQVKEARRAEGVTV